MKNILTIALMTLIVGCGGYQERTTGLEEDTMLVIRGESLIGLTVSIDSKFDRTITENDLTQYKMGLLGVADREVEKLEAIFLNVDDGTRHVTVSRGSQILVDQKLHFTAGQSRELRIKE